MTNRHEATHSIQRHHASQERDRVRIGKPPAAIKIGVTTFSAAGWLDGGVQQRGMAVRPVGTMALSFTAKGGNRRVRWS